MKITGTFGDDWMDGTDAADILEGLTGNDIYTLNHLRDRIVEESWGGIDTVRAFGQNRFTSVTLPKNCENLAFGENTKTATGNDLDNHITGNGLKNTINGKAGDDWINGMGDADILIGGPGADLFNYSNLNDSSPDGGVDTIRRFKGSDGDLIDLRAAHANGLVPDDAEFHFIGAKDFSGEAGELRFRNGILQGDADGDGDVDLQIKLGDVLMMDEFLLL